MIQAAIPRVYRTAAQWSPHRSMEPELTGGYGPEEDDTSHALVHDISFEAGQHAMSDFNENPCSGTASSPAPSGAALCPLFGWA